MAIPVPVYDDITIEQLYQDPYPVFRRLRKESPIAWVSAANIHLVTSFDLIAHIDTHPEDFPAYDPRSLQLKSMGHTMMRKDFDAHRAERSVVQKSVTAKLIKEYWRPRFRWIIEDIVAQFTHKSSDKGEADLFSDFAAPMASRCLMELLGLINVRWDDLCEWSQTLMDATGNYGDDPDIWARQRTVSALIDESLDEMIAIRRKNPDPSFLSMMANHPGLSLEQIRANAKVIIGGGINEPRDATCTALWGLLAHPEQLEAVKADPSEATFANVFDETIRYCAPIGLYPRRVGHDLEIGGYQLKQDDMLGLCVGSACHDEKYWSEPEKFDISRPRRKHLAFGIGPHLCLGFQIARMQVGQLSVPYLLEKLPGLRLNPDVETAFGGWVFRGPLRLPVKWDI